MRNTRNVFWTLVNVLVFDLGGIVGVMDINDTTVWSLKSKCMQRLTSGLAGSGPVCDYEDRKKRLRLEKKEKRREKHWTVVVGWGLS